MIGVGLQLFRAIEGVLAAKSKNNYSWCFTLTKRGHLITHSLYGLVLSYVFISHTPSSFERMSGVRLGVCHRIYRYLFGPYKAAIMYIISNRSKKVLKFFK